MKARGRVPTVQGVDLAWVHGTKGHPVNDVAGVDASGICPQLQHSNTAPCATP